MTHGYEKLFQLLLAVYPSKFVGIVRRTISHNRMVFSETVQSAEIEHGMMTDYHLLHCNPGIETMPGLRSSMATNGESARRWLEENHDKVPLERIRQIRDNLAKKLQNIEESDDTYSGLLDALDVMDNHLLEIENPAPVSEASETTASLDLAPLIPDADQSSPQLSPEEKQARFQSLLKNGKI